MPSAQVTAGVFLARNLALGSDCRLGRDAVGSRAHAAPVFEIVVELKPVHLPRLGEKANIGKVEFSIQMAKVCVARHDVHLLFAARSV